VKRSKRILLGAVTAALPIFGTAALLAGPASAAPAARAGHVAVVEAAQPHAAGPCGTGNYEAEHATLTYGGGGNYGTVYLCYNSTSRNVWAIIQTSFVGACQSDNVGCGEVEVYNNDTGANKSCDIALGKTSCTTRQIPDANTTSYASGFVLLSSTGSKIARAQTASF
jgi:hypothetical protein